jgi:resuscitation-promoting factor RpfA
MESRIANRPVARRLIQAAVATVVALGAPVALAGTAEAAQPTSKWDRLAQCESGGRWNINTGNGYAGGLQFSPRTWRAFGGQGSPAKASKAQQIAVAERVLAAQGWKAWPACSKKLGYRR